MGDTLPTFIQNIIDACMQNPNPENCVYQEQQKIEAITYSYLNPVQTALSQQLAYSTLKDAPHVAYFDLKSMQGYNPNPSQLIQELDILDREDPKLINSFMKQWREKNPDITTLIIDLRFNGGGEDENSMTWASWLVNASKTVIKRTARWGNSVTEPTYVTITPQQNAFDGNIIVLTSQFTVSAAENFLLALQQYDHVTVIGEQTQGAFSDMLGKNLPNGFEFTLSNEIFSDLNNNLYEGKGLPTDIPTSVFTQSELNNHKDFALEKAITLAD
jgi:carboxyl-terminal processing protease